MPYDPYASGAGTMELDAGNVESLAGNVVVRLPVVNPSKFPMKVTSPKGSCHCFKGAAISGGAAIPVDSVGVIGLEFSRQALPMGASEQRVALVLSMGEEQHELVAKVRVSVSEPPATRVARSFPQALDLGVIRCADAIGAIVISTTIMLPSHAAKIGSIVTDSPCLVGTIWPTPNGNPPTQQGLSLSTLTVRFVKPPEPGDFVSKVHVHLLDAPLPEIVVPVRAVCVQ